LRARHGKAFVEQDVEIRAGQRTDVVFNMNVGYLAVKTILAPGGTAVDDKMFYWILSKETDLEGKRKEIDINGSAKPLFKLPAGSYVLRSRFGRASFANTDVTVTAGSRNEVTVVQNAGVIRPKALSAKGGPETPATDIFWNVYKAEKKLDGSREEVLADSARKPILMLPAGNYVLSVRAFGKRHETTIAVTAGQIKDLEVIVTQ
jgi:Ca-activated chloride channel family protein